MAARVCGPMTPSSDPDEMPNRASASCASNTSRTGRGKVPGWMAGDVTWGICCAGAMGFACCGRAGTVTTGGLVLAGDPLGLPVCHKTQTMTARIASTASQKNPPPRRLREPGSWNFWCRRTGGFSHRRGARPRFNSALWRGFSGLAQWIVSEPRRQLSVQPDRRKPVQC